MKLETLPLAQLKPAEYNPRIIAKDEFEGLKESLKAFGQQENLIVNQDMTVISGHQRLEAMKALGWTEAVCNVVDLDKHQEKKLNVLMNSQAISGKFDDLKLAEILEEFKLDADYEPLRLNALEPLDLSDKAIEEDEAPEVSTEPAVSKLGEIYQLGRHRVMCGDSTDKANVDLLMGETKADMVFTDPPYGIDWDTDYTRFTTEVGFKRRAFEKVKNDFQEFDPTFWLDNYEKLLMFGANCFSDRLPLGSWIVWDKRHESGAAFLADAEVAWYTGSGAVYIIAEVNQGMTHSDDKKYHPTQKPIKLCAKILDKIKAPSVVIDPYIGSGSTLIACEQTDRTCYGMELDPKYVDVIRKRYAKFIGEEESWQTVTLKLADQQ